VFISVQEQFISAAHERPEFIFSILPLQLNHLLTKMAKDPNRCCGLPMMKGAAAMGVLQTFFVILLLATTAVVLERTHAWKQQLEAYPARNTRYYDENYDSTTRFPAAVPPLTTTAHIVNVPPVAVWPADGYWYRDSSLSAFIELHLAHHIAFYALWLLCLIPFALAFKYYRAALVLPNLIMQVISLILFLVLGGVLSAKLHRLSRQYHSMATPVEGDRGYFNALWQRDDINVRYAFYAILLGLLVIAFVFTCVYIGCSVAFYRWLRQHRHDARPGESPPPHVGYHRHIEPHEHSIPREHLVPKTQHETHEVTVVPAGPTHIRT